MASADNVFFEASEFSDALFFMQIFVKMKEMLII